MRDVKLYIDGQFTEAVSGRWFPLVNPATGEQAGRVAEAGRDDVDAAVQAATRALNGPWAEMGRAQRAVLLRKVADEVMNRFDAFLAAEVQDTGKPSSFARRIDIPRGAANFRIFADMAAAHHEAAFHSASPDGLGALNYTQRVPLGVVGVICPWNLPLLLMTWKVAPALAAGNTVVVKPSEETPSTATLLGECFTAAGVPEGVYNVVHGFGPGAAGEHLVAHPEVAGITFTGESATGRAIMVAASSDLKRVSFELGGKNPALVFADANFDDAVDGVAKAVFSNCGQICLCTERVYVQRPLYDRFVTALADKARDLVIGDPCAATTEMGPLISATHRDKVLSYYAAAVEDGLRVVAGGGVPAVAPALAAGSWVQPTVWADDNAATGGGKTPSEVHTARVWRDEIFGPCCVVAPFDNEAEAIALANDTRYGLAASVWTGDVKRAHRVAHRIDAGIVWVNTWFLRDLRTPFGGMKQSGIGREGGSYSMEFYTELKNVCIKL